MVIIKLWLASNKLAVAVTMALREPFAGKQNFAVADQARSYQRH